MHVLNGVLENKPLQQFGRAPRRVQFDQVAIHEVTSGSIIISVIELEQPLL